MIKLKSLIRESPTQMRILKSHVLNLCKLYNIKVKYISNARYSYADFSNKKIYITHINNPVLYSVALHEIAHCLREGDPFDIDDEILAWKWAKKNAMFWTSEMQKSMERDVKRYIPSGRIGPEYENRWNDIIKQIKSI